jgi:predicted phage terminase large subunit-like protein
MADGQIRSIPAAALPEAFDELIQSWDLSFKDLKDSDFVVGHVWGAIGADRFLLDQRRERLDMPRTVEAIRALSLQWPDARVKLVEDKANGPAVIATLKHEISGLIAVNPEGGKLVRAQACCPQCESGNVYLPHPALLHWVDPFIEECASFPNAAHDDVVDAMTQALNRLRGRKSFGLVGFLKAASVEGSPEWRTANGLPPPVPITAASAPAADVCPACGSSAIQRPRGGIPKCGQCGQKLGTASTMPLAPSRGELLAGQKDPLRSMRRFSR